MTDGLVYAHNFVCAATKSGTELQLRYDLNRQRWPWLQLPPQHPVIIEKYQYFSAVMAGQRLLDVAPNSFSALTRLRWQCAPGERPCEHAECGTCSMWQQERDLGFALSIHAADGSAHMHASGEGHVFVNRDFNRWREGQRAAVAPMRVERLPVYAQPSAACFISPLDAAGHSVTALVGASTGFHPAHPFHTGSGDHVNAGQLLDCCMQMLRLLPQTESAWISGGELSFARYVELDVPFSIHLRQVRRLAHGRQVSFTLSQAGRQNAEVILSVGNA